jgi:pimeloyl-ACP methyl ester carboxylesterase
LAVTLFTNTYNFCQPSATKPKIENAGVTIDFTDNGIGDTTLLFVHGWCINKTYWSGQVDYFKNKYRVVTMDLAGFGNSGTNRTIWTVEEFGKDVLAVIVALDLKNIILIGHSMSGEIILEAASHAPERVIGLIGIDNFTDVGKDVINQEAIDRYFEPFRNDFKKAGRSFVNSLFYNRTDSKIRARVLTDFENSNPLIAIESLRQNVNYLTKETRTLKALGLRVYLINSDKNPINKIGFDSNGIRYDLQIIDGTGHYPMIEKPTEFNLLLAKSLSGIAAGK